MTTQMDIARALTQQLGIARMARALGMPVERLPRMVADERLLGLNLDEVVIDATATAPTEGIKT